MLDQVGFATAGLPAARKDWRVTYARRLACTDLLVLIWVVFGTQILWFGFAESILAFHDHPGGVMISYSVISTVLITIWMSMLGIFGTRGDRVLGTGVEEYKLIFSTSFRLFGLVAICAFLLHIDPARGYILVAFPLGTVTLMFSRWIWRQWLGSMRVSGTFTSRVIIFGSVEAVAELAGVLAVNAAAGYLVVGACTPGGVAGEFLGDTGIRVFGAFDDIGAALLAAEADTVVVANSDKLAPRKLRELSWSLEPGRHHLVVAPGLSGIGGPRIHTRPVAGLPLIHIETPRYEGRTLFAKRAIDIVGSAILIIALSPVLAIIALSVRLGSSGPVFFIQSRVGIKGRQFRMIKFRSMVLDAERELAGLLSSQKLEGNRVMFKMANDPRITRVGRFIRRFSLDELPQLFNVFLGSMSIVGPRPPLPSELEKYEQYVHRRFLVKPGITGLWQVSGRSNLSWEDTVRLDLFYVENWSVTGDLSILWRTARAVLARNGAY